MLKLSKYLGNSGSLRQHLIRGASGSFIIRVSVNALSLATAVVLARLLGADGFGVFAFSIAVARILAVPAMLGVQRLNNYHKALSQLQNILIN